MNLIEDTMKIKNRSHPNTNHPPFPNEGEVKKYFTNEQWDSMEDYEKTSFCNIMHNYLQMEALGLNPVKPLFMSRYVQPEKKPLLKRKASTDESQQVIPPKATCPEKTDQSGTRVQNYPASSGVPVIEKITILNSKKRCLSIKLKNISHAIFEVYKQYNRHGSPSLLGKFILLRRELKDIEKKLKKVKCNKEISKKNHLSFTHILQENTTKDLNEINSNNTQRDVVPKQKEDCQDQFEQNNKPYQQENPGSKVQPLKKQKRSVQTQTLAPDGHVHNTALVFVSSAGTMRTEQPQDPKYDQPKTKREEKQKRMLNKMKMKNCRCIQTQTAEKPESIEESVLVFFPKKKSREKNNIQSKTELSTKNKSKKRKEEPLNDSISKAEIATSSEKPKEEKNERKRKKGKKTKLDKNVENASTSVTSTKAPNDGQEDNNTSEAGKIIVTENIKQISNEEEKQEDKLALIQLKPNKENFTDKLDEQEIDKFNERIEGEDDFGPDFGLEVISSNSVKIQSKTDGETIVGDWDDFDFKWSDELSPVKTGTDNKSVSEEINKVANQNVTTVKLRQSENVEVTEEIAASSSSESVPERRYPRRSVPVHCYKEDELLQDDEYLFCDLCDREYEGDCPIHGPHIIFNDNFVPITGKNDRALLTTPPILHVSMSKIPGAGSGVWTEVGLPAHARLGPYQGDKTLQPDPQGYSWMIVKDKKLDHYIAATSTVNSNWMRFVNCARHESEQNLVAFQYKGQIYYRTVGSVPPKTELFVWYGKEYAEKLGITLQSFKNCDTSHLKSLVFSCDKCNKSYTSPLYLDHHKKYCRGEKTSRVRVEVDSLPTDMQSLARVVDDRKMYFCPFCQFNSNNSGNVKIHLVTHTGVKAHECDECGKRFTRAGDLTVHKRIHSAVKCYKCNYCPFSSVQAVSLKRHMTVHTGEKMYACPNCDYRAASLASITLHIRTHTGEKPFKCTQCEYKTAAKNNLKQHMLIHTGEKPFKCTQCEYKTAAKSHLKQHMLIHTGEKPHVCPQCQYSTKWKGNLTKHIARCHSK